jgi:hypothetical protein
MSPDTGTGVGHYRMRSVQPNPFRTQRWCDCAAGVTPRSTFRVPFPLHSQRPLPGPSPRALSPGPLPASSPCVPASGRAGGAAQHGSRIPGRVSGRYPRARAHNHDGTGFSVVRERGKRDGCVRVHGYHRPTDNYAGRHVPHRRQSPDPAVQDPGSHVRLGRNYFMTSSCRCRPVGRQHR